MKILVCGSMAYDTIMYFEGEFKDSILPDQIENLNVAFYSPKMRREFGGCAGNISYSLKMLDYEPFIMATMGIDSNNYLKRLKKLSINTSNIYVVNDTFTAQAFITSDSKNNQITSFHPGAMMFSHMNVIKDRIYDLAIVSPDGKEGMIQHSNELHTLNIPFIFDPGQGLPMFTKSELKSCMQMAEYLIVNEYESKLLEKKMGLKIEQISHLLNALIITKGGKGSTIYYDKQKIEIPPVKSHFVRDPTGCGDAYRSGIIYGICEKLPWEVTGRIASIIGSIKVNNTGPQNHFFNIDKIRTKLKDIFNLKI